MSVFRINDWWTTRLGEGTEDFDFGSMAIGNLDNASPPANKIATASQQGMLRIFCPSRAQFRGLNYYCDHPDVLF